MSKRGRLSERERKFILDKADLLSPAEIAVKLNRTPETVTDFIRKNRLVVTKQAPVVSSVGVTKQIEIREELRASEKWRRLKQELTTDEIRYFEEEFIKLVSQFDNNVQASEESQIFDAIKVDLLKSRNLIERRRAREDIARLERQQETFMKTNGDDAAMWDESARNFYLSLESKLVELRSAEQNKTNEFVKLQERYDRLMNDLKATRAQRIKDVETGKVSFLGLLKSLMQKDIAEREGREAGLMKMAGDKEYQRLGRLHTFEDGIIDRPILSPDTVDLEDESED